MMMMGWLLALMVALQPLPWNSVQDIPDEHIVASTMQSCPQGKVVALALHDPATGYWMLWMTPKAWSMAPFGLTEPEEGTVAKKVIQGTWKEIDGKSVFVAVKVVAPWDDPEKNRGVFCGWLYPTQA